MLAPILAPGNLPVLDGLDEIPKSARAVAISRINRELKPGEQVVVTCRTEQYRAAVSPQDGQGVVLRAAAVQLSTLQFDEIASYLRQDAGPAAVTRWNFLDTLSPESPVRRALITPLMAGLARAIYNPRPDEQARDLRHPVELCNFADRPTIEDHLFDAYIPAAYRPPSAARWTAKQAEPWFVFLARHLEYTIGSPDLAWWQLQKAAPRAAFGLVAGLGYGLMAGLISGLGFGLHDSVKSGLVEGLIVALIVWLMAGAAVAFTRKTPARGARVKAEYLIGCFLGGLVMSLVFAFFFGHNLFDFLSNLAVGVWAGLVVGFALGIQGESGDLARAINFEAVLARDRHVAVLLMLSGLTVGLAGGLAIGLAQAYQYGPVNGVGIAFTLGFPAGLAVAAILSLSQTMWPSYAFARGWLALHHRLPRQLVDFLVDAHQRGVLRQVGAVYQFRHIELQHRLARTSGKIGFYYDFQNASGEKYWVSLVKVIDPAQSADPDTAPGNGMRFVGAVFAIVGSSPQGEDVNGDVAAIASDGQICSMGLNDIAGYTNLGNRPVHVAQGQITARSVTFQMPEGTKGDKDPVVGGQWVQLYRPVERVTLALRAELARDAAYRPRPIPTSLRHSLVSRSLPDE